MPLPLALFASLLLHGLLFLPLIAAPQPPARLEVRLPPLPEPEPPPVETAASTPESKPDMALATPPAVAVPETPPVPPAERNAADRPAEPSPPRPAQAMASMGTPTQLRFYPEDAVRQGLEGDVVLQLALDDKGRVFAVEIVSSSGHPLLDRAAVSAAKNIGPLPGNPARTRLPVSFRLTP